MIGRLAVVALIAAQALALYTLGEVLSLLYGGGVVSAWILVLVALGGYFVPAAIEGLGLPSRRQGVLLAAAAFVIIYGAARVGIGGDFALWDFRWATDFLNNSGTTVKGEGDAFLGFFLILVTWTWMTRQAQDEPDLERFPRKVGLPFLAVTTLIVIAAPSPHAGEVGRAGLAFYGVAVLALTCAQLALSGVTFGEMRAGGAVGLLLAGTVAATAAGVVIIGVVFGVAGPVLGPILGKAVEAVLVIVITPFAWLLEGLLGLLPWKEPFQPSQFQPARVAKDAADGAGNDDPSAVEQGSLFLLRAVGLLVLIGVTGAAAWVFLRVRKRGQVPVTKEDRGRAGGLGEDLRGFFGGAFRRGPRTAPATGGSTAARRLYLEVAARAEREGRGRAPAATPAEYAPQLGEAFHAGTVTDEITHAFEQARYAGREPDAATVAALERRWRESLR